MVRALVAGGRAVVSVLHELNMALQADDIVIVRDGRVTHQGAAAGADTHRALEAAFDHRITVRQLGGDWVALPRPATQESSHAD